MPLALGRCMPFAGWLRWWLSPWIAAATCYQMHGRLGDCRGQCRRHTRSVVIAARRGAAVVAAAPAAAPIPVPRVCVERAGVFQ